MQTAAVVAHVLYHREGKKDSEVVGETDCAHKYTPSNHLSLAQNTSLWVSLSLSSRHHGNVSHYLRYARHTAWNASFNKWISVHWDESSGLPPIVQVSSKVLPGRPTNALIICVNPTIVKGCGLPFSCKQ